MVIVLDKRKRPLGFTTERRARKLMERRRAVMYRMFPMTIIVKDVDTRDIPDLPEYRIKTDPGAKTDGIAVVNDKTGELMLGMQVEHRAETVKSNMDTRRGARRNRRFRETLYRRKKFESGTFRQEDNHKIPPSVRSIIGNTESWVTKLSRWIRITEASIEAVRFDTQLLDNPEISGTGYQHGTLYGTEIREYLLEKYQYVCQYCGGRVWRSRAGMGTHDSEKPWRIGQSVQRDVGVPVLQPGKERHDTGRVATEDPDKTVRNKTGRSPHFRHSERHGGKTDRRIRQVLRLGQHHQKNTGIIPVPEI